MKTERQRAEAVRALLLAIAATVSPDALRAAAGSTPGPFVSDARFDQPVTLAVREQPLADFLGALRKTRHLPVRADTSTQDERITIFCRERPFGEILAAVARHLDYTWARVTTGEQHEYVLLQSAAQRQREQELRAAADRAALAALRRQIEERTAFARIPPEERRRQEVEQLRRQRAEESDPGKQRMIDRALARAESDGNRLSDWGPQRAALETTLALLQPADWERFWRGEPYRFAYPRRDGRAALTAAQAIAMVRTAVESLDRRWDDEGRVVSHTAFSGLDRVVGELELTQEGSYPGVRFRCRLLARSPDARVRRDIFEQVGGWQSVLPRDPEPTVDPADEELKRSVTLPRAGQEDPDEDMWLVDVITHLAPAVDYTLIGDAYDDQLHAGPLPHGRQALADWLRSACDLVGVRVRREGSTLFFRHRNWASLRREEVPDRITRPWEATLKRQRALPLRALCEMAARLSPTQLKTVKGWWTHRGVLAGGDGELFDWNFDGSHEALRLLAGLTPAQWQLLQARGERSVPAGRPDRWRCSSTGSIARWTTTPGRIGDSPLNGTGARRRSGRWRPSSTTRRRSNPARRRSPCACTPRAAPSTSVVTRSPARLRMRRKPSKASSRTIPTLRCGTFARCAVRSGSSPSASIPSRPAGWPPSRF
jgi:hypothetical protein